MKRLAGRVAIVTGAGSAAAIGSASAKRLAAEGATVVMADLNVEGAHAVARDIENAGGVAMVRPLDLADENSVIDLLAFVRQACGRLDILHNNASDTRVALMSKDAAITDMATSIWDRTFEINTRGTMLMIKHAIPLMLEKNGGSIVNTSSGAALRGDLFTPAYAASKAAVNCLTMYVATQYGKQGIRCNAVSPGLIVTGAALANIPQAQLDLIETHKLTPHLGAPEDIANAVAFLASDDARFVTAQIIQVDGGITNHMPQFAENIGYFTAAQGDRPV